MKIDLLMIFLQRCTKCNFSTFKTPPPGRHGISEQNLGFAVGAHTNSKRNRRGQILISIHKNMPEHLRHSYRALC